MRNLWKLNVTCTAAAMLLLFATVLVGQTVEQVSQAVEELDAWLGDDPNGDAWRRYLRLDALHDELDQGDDANHAVVGDVLAQFKSGAAGLDRQQFTAVRDAVEAWLVELQLPTADELPEFIQQQQDAYQPVGDQQLIAARARLQDAVANLNRYLFNSPDWKRYLHWDRLEAQVAEFPTDADVQALVAVFKQFRANHPGLELKRFRQVADALAEYIDLVAVAQMEDPQARYRQTLSSLAEDVESLVGETAADKRWQVGQRLGTLAVMRQAPHVIDAVRKFHSRPNLYVEADDELVTAGMAREVNRTSPITDSIMGASIQGTGHTVGNVRARLIPNDEYATWELVFRGNIRTNTTGYSQVTFYSSGNTSFTARKRFAFGAGGMTAGRSVARAVTDNYVTDVAASGYVREEAFRRIAQNRAASNRIAAQHAEDRIERRFDEQALEQLAESNANFNKKFRDPLLRLREFPEAFATSTTADSLRIRIEKANRFQLAAPGEPPAVEGDFAMTLRAHESLPSNMAGAVLAGRTFTGEEIREQIKEFNEGELPEELEEDEDTDPWSITLAEDRPITIEIGDMQGAITIRGQGFTKGGKEYKAMNISAEYEIEVADEGLRFVRQGDLTIEPPGFGEAKRKLSPAEVAFKSILNRKFEKVLKPEIVTEGLELTGNWKHLGRLKPVHAATADGWLTLGYELTGEQPAGDTGN